MAVKDHTLDEKIVQAATAEFMEHGFHKASLHKIAARAGLTTGALYTRYKNKDDLFCSLVVDVLNSMREHAEPLQQMYYSQLAGGNPASILDVIRAEEQVYLDVLFQNYEACVLFFCRSAGSSIETMLKDVMELKSRQTVEFLRRMAKPGFDLDGVDFIIMEQFQFYRQILEKGYTREQAIACLKNVEKFMEAGWKDLFNRMMA